MKLRLRPILDSDYLACYQWLTVMSPPIFEKHGSNALLRSIQRFGRTTARKVCLSFYVPRPASTRFPSRSDPISQSLKLFQDVQTPDRLL